MKTQNFEEAKELNLSLGVKYCGHIGFHKRALLIAENACKKNKKIQEMVNHLKENPFTQKEEIEKYCKDLVNSDLEFLKNMSVIELADFATELLQPSNAKLFI